VGFAKEGSIVTAISTPVFSQLLLPWPTRRNPFARAYARAAADLLVGVGLITDDRADRGARRFQGVVVLDPYVYPYASLDRLLVAGAFSQWLFFLDDQYDDHPALGRNPLAVRQIMERYFEALSAGRLPPSPTPFARFTVYLRRRLEALSPPGWMPRFLRNVHAYLFDGSLRTVEHWAEDRVPSTDDYLGMRMHDSAVFPAVDMIEIAAGIRLPLEVLEHPSIIEMRQLTVRHTAYVNDLFSYQKEVLWSGTPCNLVRVLMHNESIGFEDAVGEIVAMVNRDVQRFVELERGLPSFESAIADEVDAYVTGMKDWMRGNVEFSLASSRYRAPDSPFLELGDAMAEAA
jgi:5-epi-alpha-selinene synthase